MCIHFDAAKVVHSNSSDKMSPAWLWKWLWTKAGLDWSETCWWLGPYLHVCKSPPAQDFFNNGHVSFFLKHAHLARASCRLFNSILACCDPAFLFSLYLSLMEGWSFCWYKSATVWGACTSWMSSQPWRKSSKSLHSNRWKAVLVLLALKTDNGIFFDCFSIFWTVSDIVFKADNLANLWFIF